MEDKKDKKDKINIYYFDGVEKIEINELILTSILIEQNKSFNDVFKIYVSINDNKHGYFRKKLNDRWEFCYDN